MSIIESFFLNKFPVGSFHTSSIPLGAAAKRKCHKLSLHLSLFSHIRLFKEIVYSIVSQNFCVKDINNLFYGVIFGELLEKSDSFLVFHRTLNYN